MQRFESQTDRSRQFARVAARLGAVMLLCWLAGCGTATNKVTVATAAAAGPQTYFAPVVGASVSTPLTYTLDDAAPASFSQTTYQPLTEPGPQVLNAGDLIVGQRGLRSLDITANYSYSNNTGTYELTAYSPSKSGSFAVELAGQTGGLVQMLGQPVQPLVAATQCPNFSSAKTFQFLTIPAALSYLLNAGIPPQPPMLQPAGTWNPKTDTAYGSVDIVSSGSAVTFKNIHQYTLPPSTGGTGAPPVQAAASTVTGACGPTFFGSITTVPGQLVVTDPGENGVATPAQAEIGIGSSGLLVENNGNGGVLAGTSPLLPYENVLGAGTGAVGLPMPSSPLAGSVFGEQYLGFIYAAGATSPSVPFSSNLASFGFPASPQPGCASFAAQTGALVNGIYGGDFPVNAATGLPDPGTAAVQQNGGYGNCDLAIDLGTESTASNGLYPAAKVWIGSHFFGNSTNPKMTYSFPAVAIAGQLNGKYAVFVLGVDSTQPWAIYLLQSN